MSLKISGWGALILTGLLVAAPGPGWAQSVTARNKFKLGRSTFEKGDFKGAIVYLEQALKEEPMYPDAEYVEGLCYLGLKDFKKAREKLEYCINLDPSFLPAHQRLGDIYLHQNDFVKARAVFAAMAKVPGGGASATYCLGVVAYEQKNLAEAEKEWTEAAKMDPKMARARNNLGVLHQMKEQHQMALSDFKNAAALAPENPMYLLNQAFEYFELGDKGQVRQLCDRVQRLSNQRYDVGFLSAALLSYLDNQFDRCIKACDSAIDRDPEMTSALLLRARALEKLKRSEEARAAYQAALDSDPNLTVAAKALAAMKPAAAAPVPGK